MSEDNGVLRQFEALDNVGGARARQIFQLGFKTMADLAKADPKDIAELNGVSDEMVESIIAEAKATATDDDAGVRFKLNASVKGLKTGKAYTKKEFDKVDKNLFGSLKKLHAIERVG